MDCHKFKSIVTFSRHYGHVVIDEIMKSVKPIIMEDTIESQITKNGVVTPLPTHINKVITFVDK